jgi:peroxiredoxin
VSAATAILPCLVDTLAGFADARGIEFPVLSDEGSVVIKEYDLLNREQSPGVRFYGIPYPGTFILDAEGRVTERFFEQAYQERFTVSSIMVALGEAADGTDRNATRLTTDHLEALA